MAPSKAGGVSVPSVEPNFFMMAYLALSGRPTPRPWANCTWTHTSGGGGGRVPAVRIGGSRQVAHVPGAGLVCRGWDKFASVPVQLGRQELRLSTAPPAQGSSRYTLPLFFYRYALEHFGQEDSRALFWSLAREPNQNAA